MTEQDRPAGGLQFPAVADDAFQDDLDREEAAAIGITEDAVHQPEPPEFELTVEEKLAQLQQLFRRWVQAVRTMQERQAKHHIALDRLIRELKPREVPDRLLSTAEVADRLGISERTVYRYIRQGRVPAVRVGPRIVKVPESGVTAAISRFHTPRGNPVIPETGGVIE